MRETKTKKALLALFLIPLAAFLSLFFTTVHSTPTYAACAVEKTTYTLSDDGKTVTETRTGGTDTTYTPGGATGACLPNKTTKYTEKDSSLVYETPNGACTNQVILSGTPKAGTPVSASYKPFTSTGACSPTAGAKTGLSVAVGAGYTGTASADGGDGTTEDTTTSCNIDGIGWLLCPVIDFGANIADAALGFLSSTFLETKTDLYSNTSPTYAAWQWILGFANIIFVVIFLVIIFSQATGFGISNYGIKKMLPKLIIGVVLINLSFFICSVMVDASNLAGYGFNKFFDTLSNGIKTNAPDPLATGSLFGGIATGMLTIVGIGLALYAALAFFIPVLIAAVVGLLMIFLFLVARQALIVMCIIIAPLAFAAWLLPNTEKLFKRWWSIFVQLLLLFPIVALVFGASKLVSRIITDAFSGDNAGITGTLATASSVTPTNGTGNMVGQIIGAAVLVVPLFAVPFLLKGAISGIPVVGKLAQRAYGNATGGARKRTGNITNPAFAGLRAQQRAGVRGFMGRNRVRRDENGKVMYDEEGNMLRKARPMRDANGNIMRDADGKALYKNNTPAKRNFTQLINDTKRSLDDNEKSYDKLADAQYERRAVRNPSTLAGQAHQRNQDTDIIFTGQAKAEAEKELAERRVLDPNLRSADQRTQAQGLATRTAQTERLGSFARNLSSSADPTLLNIAQGEMGERVEEKGRRLATAYASEAIISERKKNIESQKISEKASIRQEAVQTGRREVEILGDRFKTAAGQRDTEKLSALGELMLQQGSAGYDKFDESITANASTFSGSAEAEDMWRDFSGHMVDVKAGDLKVRRRDALGALYLPKMDTEAIKQIKLNPSTVGGLTAKETATQTAPALRQAAAVGGLDLTRARSILLEDGLVQEMSNEQIEAVMSTVMYADAKPETRDAAKQTAMLIQEADTYPRFDFKLREQIDRVAGREAPNYGGKARLQEDQIDPNTTPTTTQQAQGASMPDPGPNNGQPQAPPPQRQGFPNTPTYGATQEDNAPFTEGSGFSAGGADDTDD